MNKLEWPKSQDEDERQQSKTSWSLLLQEPWASWKPQQRLRLITSKPHHSDAVIHAKGGLIMCWVWLLYSQCNFVCRTLELQEIEEIKMSLMSQIHIDFLQHVLKFLYSLCHRLYRWLKVVDNCYSFLILSAYPATMLLALTNFKIQP